MSASSQSSPNTASKSLFSLYAPFTFGFGARLALHKSVPTVVKNHVQRVALDMFRAEREKISKNGYLVNPVRSQRHSSFDLWLPMPIHTPTSAYSSRNISCSPILVNYAAPQSYTTYNCSES